MKKKARTYHFEPSVIEQISQLAAQLDAYPSVLVDLLMQRALEEVRSGRWVIQRTPVKYRVHW